MQSNCWEYKKCGREPGGAQVTRHGICPAAVTEKYHKINDGKNAGRVCWLVAGHLCQNNVQGTFAKQYYSCQECDFYQLVNYFETIVRHAEEGVCIFDHHGILIDRNERLVEILGQRLVPGQTTIHDLSSINFYQLDHTPIKNKDNPLIRCLEKKQAVKNSRFIFKPFSTVQKYLESNVVFINSYEGQPIIVAFFRDITRNKLVEETLAANEKKYRHLFHANLMGVFFFSQQNIIYECNQCFADLIGYQNHEIENKLNWHHLIADNSEFGGSYLSQELVKREKIGPLELWLQPPRGSRFPVSFSAAYLPEQAHSVAIIEDISERKKMDEMRNDFITTVSHELRTPMTSLLCYLKMLVTSQHFAGEDLSFLKRVECNAKRLSTLINTMLEVERLEMGPRRVNFENLDMYLLCRQALDSIAIQAQMKKIEIRSNLSDVQAFIIQGVKEDLSCMLNNLLSNAIKYTESGFVNLQLAWCNNKSELVLTIQDSGIGLKPEETEKIFEGFYRAKGAVNNHIPGTGLGMRIVKDIIDRHLGQIKVESKIDIGTTVTITLPKIRNEKYFLM